MACGPSSSFEGFATTEIVVGELSLNVAVASASPERRQGLRGVEELPSGIDGMLFVFEETRTASFGMRDTLIPLDIWWFDAGGRLIGMTEMEPCPGPPCPTYPSPGEVAWALETPMGEWEFAPGDVMMTTAP